MHPLATPVPRGGRTPLVAADIRTHQPRLNVGATPRFRPRQVRELLLECSLSDPGAVRERGRKHRGEDALLERVHQLRTGVGQLRNRHSGNGFERTVERDDWGALSAAASERMGGLLVRAAMSAVFLPTKTRHRRSWASMRGSEARCRLGPPEDGYPGGCVSFGSGGAPRRKAPTLNSGSWSRSCSRDSQAMRSLCPGNSSTALAANARASSCRPTASS